MFLGYLILLQPVQVILNVVVYQISQTRHTNAIHSSVCVCFLGTVSHYSQKCFLQIAALLHRIQCFDTVTSGGYGGGLLNTEVRRECKGEVATGYFHEQLELTCKCALHNPCP